MEAEENVEDMYYNTTSAFKFHRLSSVKPVVLNRFNTFPVSITQYRRGCVLQQHCCSIQISVKS